MYIQSMTGYGRGESGNFKVEVRSSNQKNLDIRINVPSYLYRNEPDIRKRVKEQFHRGRVEIFITRAEEGNIKLKLNKSLAKEYYQALASLKDELLISEDIGINVLALQKDIFSVEEQETDVSSFYKALDDALEDLMKMRLEEGKILVEDISKRLGLLKDYLAAVEEKKTDFIQNAHTILAEKLQTLLGNTQIDDSRIIQETAILIERSDITEEIVRIKSHLRQEHETLGSGGVVGKKIDFLTQELNREVNTIGSKAVNSEISILVVEMKHEIEKIREQVQNLQ